MIKLYQFKQAIIGEYIDPREAFITRGKYLSQYSSYRGGTSEYMNVLVINFVLFKFRRKWHTTEYAS